VGCDKCKKKAKLQVPIGGKGRWSGANGSSSGEEGTGGPADDQRGCMCTGQPQVRHGGTGVLCSIGVMLYTPSASVLLLCCCLVVDTHTHTHTHAMA
jgi:hypothetical protein